MTIAQQLKITTFPFEIKDENGNTIYSEFSNRYWVKSEYDQDGNVIYTEDSYGDITDNRPKPEPELTAVEWLEKQLDPTQLYWQKYYIDQAKAMEKEQMLELISFVRVHNKMGKTAEDLLEQFEAYKGSDK